MKTRPHDEYEKFYEKIREAKLAKDSVVVSISLQQKDWDCITAIMGWAIGKNFFSAPLVGGALPNFQLAIDRYMVGHNARPYFHEATDPTLKVGKARMPRIKKRVKK